MGTQISEALSDAPDIELIEARFDRSETGASLVASSISDVDAVVDVTTSDAAVHNLPLVAASGADAVVGATGFDESQIATLHDAFVSAGKRCFIVPNFAIGAVLMMQFAQQAAPYFDGVEIVELHHDQKKDAPSGTAKLTAERIGGDVPIHSVRLPGLVAHQEVILGTTGQSLTIRHDSYDRSVFMPGVLLSLRNLSRLEPGVTTGLDAVL